MAGRPRKEIDQRQFEGLCGLQCTVEEMCGWFGVSPKTLYSWVKRTYGENFSTIFSQKRERGKISLRRSQWRLAEKNASMAIFLGKQYLGQRDQATIVHKDGNNLLEVLAGLEKDIHTDDLPEV